MRSHLFLLATLLAALIFLASCESQAHPPAHTQHAPTQVPAETPTATPSPSSTSTVLPTDTPEPSLEPPTTDTAIPTKTRVPNTLTPTAAPSTTTPPLIAIDPGHGGPDLGARHFDSDGHMDFCEAEINLALSLDLRDLLVQRGYRVVMTRDADYGLNPDGLELNGDEVVDHVDELQIRLDMINQQAADLLVSIHQNAFYTNGGPAEDIGGIATFYCADREFGEKNLLLGQLVHSELLGAFRDLGYDIQDRGVLDDLVLMTPDEPGTHLIVLGPTSDRIVRPSQMPGILSETLFITHAQEAELIQRPDVQARLALAYADGITAFIESSGLPED